MTAESSAAGALSPSEIVARERPLVRRLLIIAGVTGLIGAVSAFVRPLLLRDIPTVTLVEDLRDAAGLPLDRAGLRSAQLDYLHDHMIGSILTAVGQSIFVMGLGYFLLFLFEAIRARGGKLPTVARLLALVGAIVAAVCTLGVEIVTQVRISEAVSDRAWLTDPRGNTAAVLMQFGVLIGWLAVAAATIYMALGAMRTGLLTRFHGILGMVVGALMVPFNPAISGGGAGTMTLLALWMVIASAKTSGRLPSGGLPAWETGTAVPWPPFGQATAGAGGKGGAPVRTAAKRGGRSRAEVAEPPAPPRRPSTAHREPTTAAPSPATSKKKRKRRH